MSETFPDIYHPEGTTVISARYVTLNNAPHVVLVINNVTITLNIPEFVALTQTCMGMVDILDKQLGHYAISKRVLKLEE